MALYLPQRWRQKPTFPVRLDPNNAFARQRWELIYLFDKKYPPFGLASPTVTQGASTYSFGTGGSCVSSPGATRGTGVNFGTNTRLQISTLSGIAVTRRLGNTQVYNVFQNADINVGTEGGFAVTVNPDGTVSLTEHDWEIALISSNAVPQNELTTVAWSYNAITGRARIAVNGVLTSGTKTLAISHFDRTWSGCYYGTTADYGGANEMYFLAISSDECFNDALLVEHSRNPWQLFAPQRRTLFFGGAAAAGNTTVTPTVGSIVVSGLAPTLKQNTIRQPSVGSVVVSGLAPTVKQNTIIAPAAGSVIVTGLAPALKVGYVAKPTVGSVVVTGNAPTLKTNTFRQPTTGSVIVSGNAPVLITGGDKVVNPNAGTVVVTGNAPTLKTNTFRQPDTGSVKVTGNAPTLRINQPVSPGSGQIIVSGLAPTISTTGHVVRTPSAGQIIVSGNAPMLLGVLSAQQLAELYGGNIFVTKGKKKKKKKKPEIEEMVFAVSQTTDGKKAVIKALPKEVQDDFPDPQLALVSELVKKINAASDQVQKKVEAIYKKRKDDEDDEDDIFVLLM